MADIRTTGQLDDFDRAAEDPLSWGGKWEKAASFYVNMAGLYGSAAGMSSAGSSVFFWTPDTFDGDVEVWGTTWGTADLTEGWRLGLIDGPGSGVGVLSGYQVLSNNSIGGIAAFDLRKYSGGSFSVIGSSSGSRIDGGGMMMLRRSGDQVQVWTSYDGGANWTNLVDVTDTDFTTNLSLCIGLDSDDSTGEAWDGFGGGVLVANTTKPRIIRRTHRSGYGRR